MCVCVCVCVCVCACVRACVCVSVCVRVSVFMASDSSETVEVIIGTLGTVTALDMIMHHVLITLTLTIIQGHTDPNDENDKCLLISETIQAMRIKFSMKIVRLKVSISQTLFKLFQTWHDSRLMDALYAHSRFDYLDLDARGHSGSARQTISIACPRQPSQQSASHMLKR